MDHITVRNQLDQLARQVKANHNLDLVVRNDLIKMLHNCNNKYTEMDRESVECRRLKKVTSRYTELGKELQSLISSLEKRITWANLL